MLRKDIQSQAESVASLIMIENLYYLSYEMLDPVFHSAGQFFTQLSSLNASVTKNKQAVNDTP